MDKQTAKLIARIAENLPSLNSADMQGWIDSPKLLQVALQNALWISPTFPVSKTIILGRGPQTADEFYRELEVSGCKLDPLAEGIFKNHEFRVVPLATEFDLVFVSVAGLGFKGSMTRTRIYARAEELGLSLCHPEIGPQLRLQYLDQPKGEHLIIAMEPIYSSDGVPLVFEVGATDEVIGKFWLSAEVQHRSRLWDAYERFVFVKHRPLHVPEQ